MDIKIRDRPVVLITGALSGIGRATALAFARESARILISGRREEAGVTLADELRRLGAEAEYFQADVRQDEDVRKLINQCIARFDRLDVAVNSAGTEGQPGPIIEQNVEGYRTVFDSNVLGTLMSLKHELRIMLAQGSGSIVNLSSIVGKVGMGGAATYAASKHAVEGLTKSAALEVARSGIRVNAVAPGPVESEMLSRFTGGIASTKADFLATVPMKRAATLEEVAQTIVFLGSDKARYLTGQSIAVDGAYTAQ